MGGYCNIRYPRSQVSETPFTRGILMECATEFARHTSKPLGVGVADAFVAIFDETVGQALAGGETWSHESRTFVLHYARQLAREVERTTAHETHISSTRLEDAKWLVIQRGRAVEARRKRAAA